MYYIKSFPSCLCSPKMRQLLKRGDFYQSDFNFESKKALTQHAISGEQNLLPCEPQIVDTSLESTYAIWYLSLLFCSLDEWKWREPLCNFR
jgi:hypothetical protein